MRSGSSRCWHGASAVPKARLSGYYLPVSAPALFLEVEFHELEIPEFQLIDREAFLS